MDSCPLHGYRYYDGNCSICAGTSNMTQGKLCGCIQDGRPCAKASGLGMDGWVCEKETGLRQDTFSLDQFLAEVKDSCTNHAERKGYTNKQGCDSGDVLAGILSTLGVTKDHAIGEIIAKIVEYKRMPRRVLLVKIAGWCWLAWQDTEK